MEAIGEFQDWEVLQNTDTRSVNPFDSIEDSRDLTVIEGDSEGLIRSDYFTLDSERRYSRTVREGDLHEEGSVESDNPSWVDPSSEPRFGDDVGKDVSFQGIALERSNSGEFWSDSSSDRSVSQRFSNLEEKNELGCGYDAKNEVASEKLGEIEVTNNDSVKFWSVSDAEGKGHLKVGDVGGEIKMDVSEYEARRDEPEFSAEVEGANGSELAGAMAVDGGKSLDSAGFVEAEGSNVMERTGNVSIEEVKSGEGEKKRMVWWKLPLELLKFCVFRVSPVWSFSVAAAVVGFVILRRRLYRMKRKSRSITLNVTVEDKVSQFMSRAARLNEAFSVVRRVPIIRPSPPMGGVTPWPVMGLR
ncbi:PREDICTED: uncharacterized protein LOC104610197 isoform X2 [Nelumbo nucifera]|uniref:Uncharacterized protein LOC104610197 isoform X2 n=1 Tax=Nelumbo nucifera TaxID=4432 RepID=A0A1U8BE91_NELNU|nr:PREDICTED: uncharacterized protein LOC104610197 isoform X2 [Nelumbo nucifera]